MRAQRLACLAVFGLIPLSGCTLLHSNIKGGFACAAPRGTCAPSMTIDDSAIDSIRSNQNPTNNDAARRGTDQDGKTTATGPNPVPDGERIFIAGRRPALKVMFPAWRDTAGLWHPRTTAYTPVDARPATAQTVAPIDGEAMARPDTTSLLAVAEMAPEIAPQIPPAPPPSEVTERPEHSGPGLPVVPPLTKPATGTIAPLDAIKDQVKQILSAASKATNAIPERTTAPGAGSDSTKPAVRFPPAGN